MSTLKANNIVAYTGNVVYVEGLLSSSVIDQLSQSFDQRIVQATNEQYIAGFATTSSLNSLSQSVANVTGDFSSSVATSFSSSNAAITALSSSVSTVTGTFSSSVATSFSQSAYNISVLSSSLYQLDATQSTNITTISASAWGAFQSASAYSASNYTVNSTQNTSLTTISGSAWGAYTSASAYSASIASRIDNLSYNVTLFTGSGTYTASVNFTGQTSMGGVISPAAISTNQNNYNPSGLATCNIIRIQATTNTSITGLQAPSPASGQLIHIVNVGASTVVLSNNDLNSLAANRFQMSSNKNLTGGEGTVIWYDTISACWRRFTS